MEAEMVIIVDMGKASSRPTARADLPVINAFARTANASKRPAVSPPVVSPFPRNNSILNPPFFYNTQFYSEFRTK
jgi:hypothetical protein